MKMKFKFNYIEEPRLQFSNGEAYNPLVGLCKYGPRFASKDEKDHKWLKVGLIGSSHSLSATVTMLDEMRSSSIPKKVTKWNIPFPGLCENSPLNFSLSYLPAMREQIYSEEIEQITAQKTRFDKVAKFLEIIEKKIKNLSNNKSPPPEVIIVSIPREIEEVCKDPSYDNPLLKLSNDDDFHNRIKLYGMKYGVPTQIIRPNTLDFKGTQEKATVFWNLAVGLLYKSQKGHPWKLAELEENTCYVGISFYVESGSKKASLRSSVAQVFLDTGESFVLRGDAFKLDPRADERTPHLDKDNAKKIIQLVLDQFKEVRKSLPRRLVIHKSSNFWDEETEGFQEAAKEIKVKDFVTILDGDLRFYREGEYPILRGSLFSTENLEEHYLYTTGFVPCLNTYPGLGIPKPLLIRCKVQDSEIQKICQEILAFTKLDWNNTFIYRKEPATIHVSRRVGWVLSESIAKDFKDLDPHYYYYM